MGKYYTVLIKSEMRLNSTFMCVASFEKTVHKGLGNFPTRGICITDALLAKFVLELQKMSIQKYINRRNILDSVQ